MKRFLSILVLIPVLLSAQAPLNNANTYSINLGTIPITDVVSSVSETVGGASQTAILAGRVAFMQELATLAKTDAATAALLNKWGVKVADAAGNQIFP